MEGDKLKFALLKQGNQVVFKQLFDQHYYALKGFSKKFISRDDVCDDLVQKAFISLWEHAKELKHVSAIKSYLYSAVRNGCLNYLSRENGKFKDVEALDIISSDSTFEDMVIEQEVYSEVYKAIKNLSAQSRRIVIHSMNGLKNEEIADDLGISINTVKTLKKNAYSKLRKELDGVSWILFMLLV